MSFSLALDETTTNSADLQVKGSALGIVYGVDKLKQDVSLWLRERYRSDRFHSNYGSVLDNYIGTVIDFRIQSAVRAEVLRVLQNYQSLQYRMLREQPERLSADEIMVDITSIDVQIVFDAVNVTIRFVTGSKQVSQLSIGLGI